MQYTRENIQTQINLKRQAIKAERLRRDEVKSPDWPLAKEYGEEVRFNHIRTINGRIAHYQKQILDLLQTLARMEIM